MMKKLADDDANDDNDNNDGALNRHGRSWVMMAMTKMMMAMQVKTMTRKMTMMVQWIEMRGDRSGWRGGKGKGTPGAWKAERERGNKMSMFMWIVKVIVGLKKSEIGSEKSESGSEKTESECWKKSDSKR